MTESSSSTTTPQSSTMQQAKFLLLCGLVLQDSRDRRVFEKMEEEVSHAAERLLTTIQLPLMTMPSSLSDTGPPLSLITEAAMEKEILRTFDLASPETKAIYSLAGGDDGGNWMIRWMLWGRIARGASQ